MQRRPLTICVTAACAVLLAFTASVRADLITFESPTYAPGDVVGQDGWRRTAASAETATVINTDDAGGGAGQCVEFANFASTARFMRDFTPVLPGTLVTFEYDMKVVNATTMTAMDFRCRVVGVADSNNIGICPGNNVEPLGINNSWYGSTSPTGTPLAFFNEAQVNPRMLCPKASAEGWRHYKWVAYFGTGLGDGVGRLLYGELDGVRYYYKDAYIGGPLGQLDRFQVRLLGTGNAIVRIDNLSVSSVAFTPTPPTVNAGPDLNIACGAPAAVQASGTDDGSVERYVVIPNSGTGYGNTSIGNSQTSPIEVEKVCSSVRDLRVYSVDADGIWSTAFDTMLMTTGDFESYQLAFDTLTTGPVSEYDNNGLASDGTNLYFIKRNGEFYTSADNGVTWTQRDSAPNSAPDSYSGCLAYAVIGGSPSLVTNRWTASTSVSGICVYDITGGVWTQYANDKAGFSGLTVAGNYAYANCHASDINQGGHLSRVDLTDLSAATCARSTVRYNISGPNSNWFSRVVHMALASNGDIYGFKNDQTVGYAGGDRFWKFNPADFGPNYYVGPNYDNWTKPDKCTPSVDLGQTPFQNGRGAGICSLPANWGTPDVVGAQGGFFYVPGQQNSNLEGWAGTQNQRYAIYDIATEAWKIGYLVNPSGLPIYSGSGTAVTFHDGKVFIKQGCTNPGNPDADVSTNLLVTDGTPGVALFPPTANAGPDQTLPAPGVITLDGSASTYNPAGGATSLTTYAWTLPAPLGIVYGVSPQIVLPAGATHTVSLVVTDDLGVSSSPDVVQITVPACAGSDEGYVNDCSTSAGITGPAQVQTITFDGDDSVYMDIFNANGYYPFRVTPVCPFDASNGEISFRLRVEPLAGSVGTVGWWLRVYTTGGGYHGYFFLTDSDGWWHDVSVCVDDYNTGEGGTPANWNPAEITGFRIEAVIWGGTSSARLGMGNIEFTKGPVLTVEAGDHQGPYTVEGCELVYIDVSGSGSPEINTWTWTDETGRVLGTSPSLTGIPFLPGVHTLTLRGEVGCAWITDSLTLTIYGDTMLGLPVNLALDQQINPDPFLNPTYDLIQGSSTVNVWFPTEGPLTFTRGDLNTGDYYFGPKLVLPNACYTPVNVTNTYIRFTARYFQQDYPGRNPAAYTDAPIGVRLLNANGTDFSAIGTGDNIQWFHGPAIPAGEEYQWKVCGGPVTLVNVRDDIFGRTAGFDLTQVTGIEFVGSDWGGLGDYIDVYDFYLGTDPLGACCLSDESCVALRTEAECDALSGVSFHPGEACGELSDSYDVAGANLPIEDISGTGTQLMLGDDEGSVVPLGFTFSFFGQDITEIGVASNGYLSTQAGALGNSGNAPIPSTSAPNSLIAVLWHDWDPSSVGGVYYQTLGSAPDRRFVAMWKEVAFWGETSPTNTFEAILYEGTNVIELRYGAVNPTFGEPSYGGATTIGVENATATIGTAVTAETIGSGGAAAGQVFTTAFIDTRVCGAAVLGDMDCSGTVTVDDIAPFIDALLGQYNVPGCDVNLADMNADTFIDGLDIPGFVEALIP